MGSLRCLKLDSGVTIAACSVHRKWYQKKRASTLHGYRCGYGAGRRQLDEYVFGNLLPVKLSPTGHFEHSCTHCHALFFSAEGNRRKKASGGWSTSTCCSNGRLRHLPLLPPAPATLAALLSGFVADDSPLPWHPFTSAGMLTGARLSGIELRQSNDLKQHVRSYNSALGFASFTDSLASSTDPTKDSHAVPNEAATCAPPVYVLHGRAYHIVGTLYPPETKKPKFAQLYVLDPASSVDARSDSFEGLSSIVLRKLLDLLDEPIIHKDPLTGEAALLPGNPLERLIAPRNPYPAYFHNMHDLVQLHRQTYPLSGKVHALRLSGGKDKDPRTYNKPSSCEVSCTVVGEGPLPRHFISVYERSDSDCGSTHELSYLSEHVDPLTYPLIHVHGTLGYSNALCAGRASSSGTKDAHISMREFYAHRFMQRYSHDSGFYFDRLLFLCATLVGSRPLCFHCVSYGHIGQVGKRV